jgi:hypothetical protein
MTKLGLDIYNAASGVVISFSFPTKEQYTEATTFLDKLVGGPAGRPEPGQKAFYYLENDMQRDAFYEFLQKLKPNR